MAGQDKIYIIGVGDDGLDGLTATARQLIDGAELIVGAELSLSAISPSPRTERLDLGGDLDALVRRLNHGPARRTVILASGDPLFYGMARFLCDRLGKDRFEVVPHVSSMQLAFARVKESWDEAYLTNLATQSLEVVAEKIRTAQKVGLFTTESISPSVVAQALLERGIDYFSAYVCENLGSPDERVTQGDLSDLAKQEFSPLNVMVLVRKPDMPDRPISMLGRRLFGNRDEVFLQSQPKRGLLTPAEVRAIALAAMDLGRTSTVWDVGAGSGSVAIEAAQIASQGNVYAIEMDADDYQLIGTNAELFGVTNLTRVLGKAPEVWEHLPDPDAVFVGGTGRDVRSIVEKAFDRLKMGGRLVANVGSIDNLAGVHEFLLPRAADAEVLMINLARGTYQIERIRFESLNPTFLVCAVKR